MRFLLFVKENLPLGVDPWKDEWITTQATRMMETFTPQRDGNIIRTCLMDIIRWRGLYFASTVCVTISPPPPLLFVNLPSGQYPTAVP